MSIAEGELDGPAFEDYRMLAGRLNLSKNEFSAWVDRTKERLQKREKKILEAEEAVVKREQVVAGRERTVAESEAKLRALKAGVTEFGASI